jgi:hypothetical protein
MNTVAIIAVKKERVLGWKVTGAGLRQVMEAVPADSRGIRWELPTIAQCSYRLFVSLLPSKQRAPPATPP